MEDPANLDLPQILTHIRQQAVTVGQQQWLALGDFLATTLPDPLDPIALLPFATGLATGEATGNTTAAQRERLVQGAALIVLANLALRIIDDCADQDDEQSVERVLGLGRAVNYAVALNNVVSQALWQMGQDLPQLQPLYVAYLNAWLTVCHGQDLDLRQVANSLQTYHAVVERKTVAAYEFAAQLGAALSTTEATSIAHCQQCGQHLGWMAQVLDDIEALWFPGAAGHNEINKYTFPLLWGLNQPGPAAQHLAAIYQHPNKDRLQICALLDEMQARVHLLEFALNHRDQALAHLKALPNPAGKQLVEIWLNWLLRDGQKLITPITDKT